MDRLAATKIDTKMLHRGTVAIVFAIVYFVQGLGMSGRFRTWGSSTSTFLYATGVEGTDSFKFVSEPFVQPYAGELGGTRSDDYPFLVSGWLGLLHPGIPVHRTQASLIWRGQDGVGIPITSRQLLDKHVPLKSLPATIRDPIHGNDLDEAVLQMLRNRQTTKWSIAWSDVAFLVAQAVCGVMCITACVQWYRLRKILGHVEAGGCIKCGYPIAPNTGTCPECGHVHGA